MRIVHVYRGTESCSTMINHRRAIPSGRTAIIVALHPRSAAAFLAVMCFVVVAGCSDRGPRRVPLEGAVTLDGKPLADGDMRFFSVPGTAPVVVDAKIKDGRFLVPIKEGPLSGKYRVEISVPRKTGRKVLDSMTGRPVDEIVESLPGRYNLQSKLTAEVTAAGPNRFEFTLTSR